MLRRCVLFGIGAFVAGIGLWIASSQQAEASGRVLNTSGAQYRESIREMPILERPNRPGHFYGNTVRRLNGVYNGRGYSISGK